MSTDTTADTRIACRICGARVHSIQHHLAEDHPGVSLEKYQEDYPDAPIFSEIMKKKLAERAAIKGAAPSVSSAATEAGPWNATKKPLHEVFGFPASPAVMAKSGKPIMITVYDPGQMDEIDRAMIPAVDPNYVFNVDVLRTLIVGIEKGIPSYLWGHAGTGKTTMWEQMCARLNRPMIRVQHTANMEEVAVVGQHLLREGETRFEPGPLMDAMRRGWLYLADEYDFGRPEVLSVYQPVLEGKPLVVKEADAAHRHSRPHAAFMFVGTGNTNGTGDETGLYAGTNIQNAANYERFGITEKMPYMDPALEARAVSAQGGIPMADAEKLVDFATRIRTEFEGGKMNNPISPRTLVFAALVGKARGSFRVGLEKAFINRLSTVDREVAGQLSKRVFAL